MTVQANQITSEWGNKAWKRGTLQQLVTELQRQLETKFDFVLPTDSLELVLHPERGMELAIYNEDVAAYLGGDLLPMNLRVLKQIGGNRMDPEIPARFVEKMNEKRGTRLAALMTGLMRDAPEKWLVRTLDGKARAVLSDRYKIVDHWDLLGTALKTAKAVGANPLEASLTETNMRLKLIRTDVWDSLNLTRAENKPGWFAGGLGNQKYLSMVGAKSWGELPGGPNIVHPVVTIGNSETGQGGYYCNIGILLSACYNIATVQKVVGKIHLGSQIETGIYTAATVQAQQDAIGMMIADTVKACFTQEKFKEIIAQVSAASSKEVKDPVQEVERLKIKLPGSSDEDMKQILNYFAVDYQPTRGGLAQAVSRRAQDMDDPDIAEMFEDLAGSILIGKN